METDVVSLRLDDNTLRFIRELDTQSKPGKTIKKILAYLVQFDVETIRNMVGIVPDTMHSLVPIPQAQG